MLPSPYNTSHHTTCTSCNYSVRSIIQYMRIYVYTYKPRVTCNAYPQFPLQISTANCPIEYHFIALNEKQYKYSIVISSTHTVQHSLALCRHTWITLLNVFKNWINAPFPSSTFVHIPLFIGQSKPHVDCTCILIYLYKYAFQNLHSKILKNKTHLRKSPHLKTSTKNKKIFAQQLHPITVLTAPNKPQVSQRICYLIRLSHWIQNVPILSTYVHRRLNNEIK